MTKLDLVLARLRKLPTDRQEAIAEEIAFRLDSEEQGAILTEEQWAQVQAALADRSEPISTHEDVFARLDAEDK
jgi:hypothetical protein